MEVSESPSAIDCTCGDVGNATHLLIGVDDEAEDVCAGLGWGSGTGSGKGAVHDGVGLRAVGTFGMACRALTGAT